MSQLDRAKKEAKRLFNLTKLNLENQSQEHHLKIPNLSSAREIVAIMNGYKNWHDYEEVLKRKDLFNEKVDKNTHHRDKNFFIENKQYFIQDLTFQDIFKSVTSNSNKQIVFRQGHTLIKLGHKTKTLFETKEKYWLLNQYPLLVQGDTGAGKTEVLLSLGCQYIQNKEGLIYLDGKGDPHIYSKIFTYCKNNERLNDLFLLNFFTDGRELFQLAEADVSHSIDPINPMVGNPAYFIQFFGQEIGTVIHAILKAIHQKNQVMDIESLESILMLNNLINWHQHKKFGELAEIDNYLKLLGLSEDASEEQLSDALEIHATYSSKAYHIIHKIFKHYPHIFKLNCSIDIEQIFLQRKVLVVLLPALEKMQDVFKTLGELIVAQITHFDNQLQYNSHMQNIIFDDITYYCKNITDINFITTKNNYIFGSNYFPSSNFSIIDTAIIHAKTIVLMKIQDDQLHHKIKNDLFENMAENPKELFGIQGSYYHNFIRYLHSQHCGQAVVLCHGKSSHDTHIINNEAKYYIQPIKCIYLPTKREKELWLSKQPTAYMYMKKTSV